MDELHDMLDEAHSSGDEHEVQAITSLSTLYYDLIRYQKRTNIEGWIHKESPLEVLSLNFDDLTPQIAQEILDTTHKVIFRGNTWFGVGYWSIAEHLFKSGMYLAISSNNVFAAIQCATNIALCYLGAESYGNAYRTSIHIQPTAIEASSNLLPRLLTIELLSLLIAKRDDILGSRIVKLNFSKTPLKRLDPRVLEDLMDVYSYLEGREKAAELQINWILLDGMIKKYSQNGE